MSSFRHKRNVVPVNKKISQKCYYCNTNIGNRRDCQKCKLIQPNAKIIVKRRQNKNIKRIFVLTLTGKDSRLNFFQKKTLPLLKEYNCFPFVGVDGRNVTVVRKMLEHFYPNNEQSVNTIMKHREKHPGSIGCYLSHMSIWDYVKNTQHSDEKYVLILEDDATFEKHGIENIEITLDKLQNLNWDILYFGHSPKVKGNVITSNIIDPSSHPYPEKRTNCGFWGYAIKITSVPKLIKAVNKFETMSIDATIQYYFGKLINPLMLIKPIVHQSAGYSIRMKIEKEGKNQEKMIVM
jgi:GR25 family glycosyltransferase involved in LPS biosynthesis